MPVNSANINFPAIKEWNEDAQDYVPGVNTGFTIKISLDEVKIVPDAPASCRGKIYYIVKDENGNTLKTTTATLGGIG